MLHHIRRSILDKLATAPYRRYSELKPSDLDGNVFVYHLKALIIENYVAKSIDGKYNLTQKGRDYIVHRYEDQTSSAHSIFLIVVKKGQQYLLRERAVQPLIGYTGFIHGEPIPSIDIHKAAQQRLADKTGLHVPLQVKGTALIAQYQNEELQSYSHAIILYGETSKTLLVHGDATGNNTWSQDLTGHNILPSCLDIVTMISRGETWFEKRYVLPSAK